MAEEQLDWRFLNTAVFVMLRRMRRKNLLKAEDLTDLRLAFDRKLMPENLANKIARLLEETVMDREEKRETPRKLD